MNAKKEQYLILQQHVLLTRICRHFHTYACFGGTTGMSFSHFLNKNILHVSPLTFALAPQRDQPPPPPAPHYPKSWVLGGLPTDETSPAFLRSNKHKGGPKFSLSRGLLDRLPKVHQQGLSASRGFVGGKGPALPFRFFEEAFPQDCQDIILEEVRLHPNFCHFGGGAISMHEVGLSKITSTPVFRLRCCCCCRCCSW